MNDVQPAALISNIFFAILPNMREAEIGLFGKPRLIHFLCAFIALAQEPITYPITYHLNQLSASVITIGGMGEGTNCCWPDKGGTVFFVAGKGGGKGRRCLHIKERKDYCTSMMKVAAGNSFFYFNENDAVNKKKKNTQDGGKKEGSQR
jgi:hypothetical protein